MHEELEDLSTRSIMEHLPPIDKAPILEYLARLGLKKFKEEYAIPTRTYENGIVDHTKLISDVSALVSDDYRWKAPFFDEHHLHWEGHNYKPELYDGDTIPNQFRELDTHKLWIPREFHNFIHATTIPPDVPPYEVMSDSIKEFRANYHLYILSSQAIDLKERRDRSILLPGEDNRVVDPANKRVADSGLYEERRNEFIQQIEQQFQDGLPPDLTHLSSLQLESAASIEAFLPQIRRGMKEAIALSSKKRRGRAVRLLIELPYREDQAA